MLVVLISCCRTVLMEFSWWWFQTFSACIYASRELEIHQLSAAACTLLGIFRIDDSSSVCVSLQKTSFAAIERPQLQHHAKSTTMLGCNASIGGLGV
jgi:hypothetical protein